MALMLVPPTCSDVVALNVGAVAVPVNVGLAFAAYEPRVVARLDDVI